MNENRMSEKIVFGISLLLLILFIIFDAIWADKMFEASINFSITLQKLSVEGLAFIFSGVIMYLELAYFVIAFLVRKNRADSFMHFAFAFLPFFIQSFMKNSYGDLRPSFVSTLLRNTGSYCEKEYGKPSGHALFSMFLSLLIFRDIRINDFQSKVKYLFLPFLILIAIFMGLSRIFYGVHSINQVVLGFLLGFSLYCFIEAFDVFLKKSFFNKFLLLNKISKHKIKLAVTIVVTYLIVDSLLLLSWGLTYRNESPDSKFYNQIINCVQVKQNFSFNFSINLFQTGTIINYCLGLIFGFIFSSINGLVGFNFFYDRSILKFIGRFLCFGLLSAPAILSLLPHDYIVAISIIRPIVIFPLIGFIVGKWLLYIIGAVGLGYQKESDLEIDNNPYNVYDQPREAIIMDK